ncbi:MAG: hypothetical protein ABI543_07230 [Ignavibacteria bacterium]
MIKANISKAQIEVWDWKDSLYEEIKDIPDSQKIDYIHKKTAKTIERFKKAFERKKLESDIS